jgi:hypothetical protein
MQGSAFPCSVKGFFPMQELAGGFAQAENLPAVVVLNNLDGFDRPAKPGARWRDVRVHDQLLILNNTHLYRIKFSRVTQPHRTAGAQTTAVNSETWQIIIDGDGRQASSNMPSLRRSASAFQARKTSRSSLR